MSKPKFKLDENLDVQAAALLRDAGYDALTISEQGLQGTADTGVAELCRREERCLVSLDLHFSNIVEMPPADYSGIVVLRHPRLRLRAALYLIRQLIESLRENSPQGQLWIVEPGRVRVYARQ